MQIFLIFLILDICVKLHLNIFNWSRSIFELQSQRCFNVIVVIRWNQYTVLSALVVHTKIIKRQSNNIRYFIINLFFIFVISVRKLCVGSTNLHYSVLSDILMRTDFPYSVFVIISFYVCAFIVYVGST